MTIHRPNQSVQSFNDNIHQWKNCGQKRFPCQYGHQHQGKNPPYKTPKSFSNRNTFGSERNGRKSDPNSAYTVPSVYQKPKQTEENSRTVYNNQKVEALIIEWDCLESFHEFAIFMDKSNPICPAEHLDTPEKLMNLLIF